MRIILAFIFGIFLLAPNSRAGSEYAHFFDIRTHLLLAENYEIAGDQVQDQSTNAANEETDESETWYENLINNTLFWIGVLLPFIFLIIIAFSVKRKIVERNKNDKESKT